MVNYRARKKLEQVKGCSSCNQTDHLRNTNLLCPQHKVIENITPSLQNKAIDKKQYLIEFDQQKNGPLH